ncbi:MAG: AAA family ATPase [Rectinemataceae bacterium]
MPGSGYLEYRIARLLFSWLEQRPWTADLYEATAVLLERSLSSGKPVEHQAFPEDPKQAFELRGPCLEKLGSLSESATVNPAIDALAQRFRLTPSETALVEFFFLYGSFGALEFYFDNLQEWDQIDRLTVWCGIGGDRILHDLGTSGKLIRSGIAIDEGRALRMPSHGITFGLATPVFSFIDSENKLPLSSFVVDSDAREILPLPAFDLPPVTMAAAKATLSLARGKPTLLFFGKPGTGKTEFSRSLSVSCGFQPCFLKHDLSGRRSFADMLLAARLVDPDREVLIIDEADELLNLEPGLFSPQSDGIKKGMINDFLDGSDARMIFISNASERIPDSIIRRFSFHLAFDDFSPVRRLKIWNSLCKGESPFTASERQVLAGRYRANPSRIRQVLDVCGSLAADSDSGIEPFRVAQEMLERSDELMYGMPRKVNESQSHYDARFLNIGMPVETLLRSLEAWKERFRENERGLNLLFYGAPGTGKTAFGRYLAGHLGLYPVIRRASDLLGPFVGMTERAIRDAFTEAEGAVLIIDEADSFLSERQTATHGWERSRTNEILTAMESFKGLFIASTNLRSVLDSASFRRFTFKIEFRAIGAEHRLDLIQDYFPGLRWSDEERCVLEGLDQVTLGDVAVVAHRFEFSREITPALVLSELRKELSDRERTTERIGFATDRASRPNAVVASPLRAEEKI